MKSKTSKESVFPIYYLFEDAIHYFLKYLMIKIIIILHGFISKIGALLKSLHNDRETGDPLPR